LAHRGGGEADLGDGHAALRVPGFGIVAEIADKDRLVDATGHCIPRVSPAVPGEGHWIIASRPAAVGPFRGPVSDFTARGPPRGLRIIGRSSSTDPPCPPPPQRRS